MRVIVDSFGHELFDSARVGLHKRLLGDKCLMPSASSKKIEVPIPKGCNIYRRADRCIIRCQRHRTKRRARCYKVSSSDAWKLELHIAKVNRQDKVD